jgi:hypothetical protein
MSQWKAAHVDDEERRVLERLVADADKLAQLAKQIRHADVARSLAQAAAEAHRALRAADIAPLDAGHKDARESPLQMAARHVVEGERRVARQRDMVESLKQDGHNTDMAQALLNIFEKLLEEHREALLRLQSRDAAWQPISTAPYDQLIELAVIDPDGVHSLVFACRRILGGWAKAPNNERLDVRPTHWRIWKAVV